MERTGHLDFCLSGGAAVSQREGALDRERGEQQVLSGALGGELMKEIGAEFVRSRGGGAGFARQKEGGGERCEDDCCKATPAAGSFHRVSDSTIETRFS